MIKFGDLSNIGEVDDISETQRLVGWEIHDLFCIAAKETKMRKGYASCNTLL